MCEGGGRLSLWAFLVFDGFTWSLPLLWLARNTHHGWVFRSVRLCVCVCLERCVCFCCTYVINITYQYVRMADKAKADRSWKLNFPSF